MRKTVEVHLDIGVAAVLLGGMSKAWVRDRIKAGEFEGFLLGNKQVVTAASVNKYLERCRLPAKETPAEQEMG